MNDNAYYYKEYLWFKTCTPTKIIVTHMVIQGYVMCFCSSISMHWWNYNTGNQGNCPRKYTSPQRITLNPVDGEIEIENNDGIYTITRVLLLPSFNLPPSQYQLQLATSSQYTLQLRLRGQYSSVPWSLILPLEHHDLLTSLPPLKMALQICMG